MPDAHDHEDRSEDAMNDTVQISAPWTPGAPRCRTSTSRGRAASAGTACRRCAEMSPAARIVASADAERRRLERNLHDGAQQRLVSLALQLRLVGMRLEPGSETRAMLDAAQAELAASLTELRELARGLHPATLATLGLAGALGSLATRAPVPVELRLDGGLCVPEAVEIAVYYLVSEALTNVAKYAGAATAAVTVAYSGGRVTVEVADDGVGGADPARGSGLRGLEDRVGALGGRLRVSSPPAGGTLVRAEIPCGLVPARAA